jgi:hypothetical protein
MFGFFVAMDASLSVASFLTRHDQLERDVVLEMLLAQVTVWRPIRADATRSTFPIDTFGRALVSPLRAGVA